MKRRGAPVKPKKVRHRMQYESKLENVDTLEVTGARQIHIREVLNDEWFIATYEIPMPTGAGVVRSNHIIRVSYSRGTEPDGYFETGFSKL